GRGPPRLRRVRQGVVAFYVARRAVPGHVFRLPGTIGLIKALLAKPPRGSAWRQPRNVPGSRNRSMSVALGQGANVMNAHLTFRKHQLARPLTLVPGLS